MPNKQTEQATAATEAKKEAKKEALRILDDELSDIKRAADPAGYLIQEINEEYFYKRNPKVKEDEMYILWDYNRYKAFADLLGDCIYKIQKTLDTLGVTL